MIMNCQKREELSLKICKIYKKLKKYCPQILTNNIGLYIFKVINIDLYVKIQKYKKVKENYYERRICRR